ncbi:hypothetical protein QFC22_004603 [Naganishia vaughanmartiniae]|uniref:Uncharacterized protein n=1 Tax=Naganishia vaughanmartiniae TaxID=1424756 RepID=A0ACC2X046_9TREE|nr:hypothetical protein QFC22_004603 [Naganishia vaughanmartiniae]
MSSSEDEDHLPSRILVLYASETGNAQDIAERTGREIRRKGGRCLVQSMVEFDIHELPHTPLLILVNSTHGRGQPPPDMVALWSALLRSGLPSDILEDVNFAIYGLGDSSYEKFCYAAKILARRMISLGAHLLTVPAAAAAAIGNGTNGSHATLDEQLERKLIIDEPENDDTEFGKTACLAWGDERAPEGGDDVLEPGWVWTRLARNKRVTDEGWFQDVREIHLQLEQALEVHLLVEATDIGGGDTGVPGDEQARRGGGSGVYDPAAGSRILRDHVDVRQPPRKSFFEWMARFTTSELEKERLEEFLADPVDQDSDESYSRGTATATTEAVLDSFFRKREIQLLVGLVEYKTNLKIKRKGLLSSWLQCLPEGYRIPTKLDAPTLFLPPPNANVPVILVGPGTGVAPMRAFAEERIRQGQGKNTVIYFGCRSKMHDFYYADEWDAMRKAGVTVRIAFSRDQDEKLYVQDLIKEDAKMIKEWIHDRKGNIYISGSSNAMPKQVRSAVAWSISDESGEGDISREEADRYVEDMFMSGTRGGEESW